MLPGQPSQTLLVPAVRRAAHQLLDTPLIFNDPIALDLVPEASQHEIRNSLESSSVRSGLAELGWEFFSREQQRPENLSAMQKADLNEWWPIIQVAGIRENEGALRVEVR
jgi:hypothetical protein